MHLGPHDIDFTAAGTQAAHLPHIILAEVVIVDVELRLRREDPFGDLEAAEGVVARHRAVPAFAELRAGNHAASAEVPGALIDDVPAVDFIAVPHRDFDDAFRRQRVDERRVFGKRLLHLLRAHPFECAPGRFAEQRIILRIVLEVRFFQVIERDFVDEPVRNLPAVAAPHERVPVQPDSLRQAELHDRIDRGAAPVRLALRVAAAIPELRRIAVFRAEARTPLLQFKLLPVERDRRGVEERAVKLFIARVALVGAELVEVENVCAENEIVRQLLDPDFASGGGSGQLKQPVGLAMLFDVGVDPPLLVVVPQRPVGVGERLVDFRLRKLRSLVFRHPVSSYCSPKSCHPSATGLGSFGLTAQKLRVLFGGPALRCSVRLRRTHTFEKGIVDIFPKSCHPSSFAEAAEDKSGLSSTAPARRMILFGGPALRCSVRFRRTHTSEKGIVDISMALTYHLHLVNMLTYTGNLKNNFSGKTAFPPDGGGKTG